MQTTKTIFPLLVITLLFACKAHKELPTVEKVNIKKYMGQWYEIARLPNRFEKGLKCVTANYALKQNGKITVINKGYSTESTKYKTAKGTARIPNPKYPGRLKVSFFWPFSGDYYIISLNEAYKYVLVGDPSRKYLWILSRTKQLDSSIYMKLLDIARKNGFDTSKVKKTAQDCH